MKDFDIVKQSGVRTALIKEFRDIAASDVLTLEFIPRASQITPATVPLLSGLEVYDQSYRVP